MSSWTTPEHWSCDVCPAAGYGGRFAKDRHIDTVHAPRPSIKPIRKPGSIVPNGIDSADVRAWGRANGWPTLGRRGRLPQELIDAYIVSHKPRPTVDLDVVDELRALGNTTVQIAQRLGVTEGAIEKAESRRRTS